MIMRTEIIPSNKPPVLGHLVQQLLAINAVKTKTQMADLRRKKRREEQLNDSIDRAYDTLSKHKDWMGVLECTEYLQLPFNSTANVLNHLTNRKQMTKRTVKVRNDSGKLTKLVQFKIKAKRKSQ